MQTIYEKLQAMLESGKPLDVKFIHVGSGTNLFQYCREKRLSYIGFGTQEFLDDCNNLRNHDKKNEAQQNITNILEQQSKERNPSKKPKINNALRQIKDLGL